MLNETLSKLLRDSYAEGDRFVARFNELTEALENNSIPSEEIIDRVGELSHEYEQWRIKHEILVSLGYATSDALTNDDVYQIVKEEV